MIEVGLMELRDRDGLGYFGAPVAGAAVRPCLDALGRHVGAERLAELTACKARRDGPDSFHLTAVTPPEMTDDIRREWTLLVARAEPIGVRLHGLGSVRDGDAVSYYIVAESPGLQRLRARSGLPQSNLHVTLGFDPHDIYHLAKDRSTLITPPG